MNQYLFVDVVISCAYAADKDGKREQVQLKAGKRERVPYEVACELSSRGLVNIPRPQPDK